MTTLVRRLTIAVLLALPPVAQAQEPVRVTAQGVMLDFQDADLRLVIGALAEVGKLNLSYGDLPQRRITLRTTQPVSPENVIALLRSLAQSHGLRVIEEGGFFRLEADAERAAAARRDTSAVQDSSVSVRLFVYSLKHARAPRLAATIQTLFGGGPAGAGAREGRPASLSEELAGQRLGEQPSPGIVDVTLGPVQAVLPGRLRGEVQVVPDEATNALLVRAQRGDWEIVRSAIETLDRRPLQVLIEVTIAEVRRSKELSTGSSFTLTREGSRTTTSAELAGDDPGGLALRFLRAGTLGIDAALSALSARGEVRILSRPAVLAQNNQEARILIGSERPFVQVFRSLPTDAGVRDQIVQYRDVGTKLTITPTINGDRYVSLQVVQEVSTATAETQFGAPVISTREAATHLFVRDGQTAVLGGLIERQREQSRSGVPLLKDVPILGALFGSTKNVDLQSELYLFITPHVIESDEDTDRVREAVERKTDLIREILPPRPESKVRADTVAIPPAAQPTKPR